MHRTRSLSSLEPLLPAAGSSMHADRQGTKPPITHAADRVCFWMLKEYPSGRSAVAFHRLCHLPTRVAVRSKVVGTLPGGRYWNVSARQPTRSGPRTPVRQLFYCVIRWSGRDLRRPASDVCAAPRQPVPPHARPAARRFPRHTFDPRAMRLRARGWGHIARDGTSAPRALPSVCADSLPWSSSIGASAAIWFGTGGPA